MDVIEAIGHNSAAELDLLAHDARLGLERVKAGEGEAIEGWLQYGEALNKGRAKFPSDEQFGVWVRNKLLHTADRPDRAAAMWAATNPDEFQRVRAENTDVRTVRGWHTIWLRSRRKDEREKRDSELSEAELLTGEKTYRVIYADPPWSYNDTRDDPADLYTGATGHYPTMTVPELCLLPVAEMVRDDAVLFLWVTSPLIFEAPPLIEAWGFTYKAMFVWDKIAHNVGHYNSVRHELLLICTRGSCTPDVPKLHDSVISIDRTGHSSKPEEFRALIDGMYPTGPRIELFRRGGAPEGWDTWGNEADEP